MYCISRWRLEWILQCVGDNVMSYMGKVRPTVALTSSDIVDGAITTDKIVDDAVTDTKVANAINTSIAANTAKVTNATHTGDVTGATALTIATDAVDIATTFLRGDNSWTAAGGDNTPAFMVGTADDTAITGITSDTLTKVAFGTEQFDTDSAYDTSLYRFTVPAGEGGKYMIYFMLEQVTSSDVQNSLLENGAVVYLNGATPAVQNASGMNVYSRSSNRRRQSIQGTHVLALDAADYIELYVKIVCADGGTGTIVYRSWWGGHKLLL
jgi:hypothetical protein